LLKNNVEWILTVLVLKFVMSQVDGDAVLTHVVQLLHVLTMQFAKFTLPLHSGQ
jgi:hypothetical protein